MIEAEEKPEDKINCYEAKLLNFVFHVWNRILKLLDNFN